MVLYGYVKLKYDIQSSEITIPCTQKNWNNNIQSYVFCQPNELTPPPKVQDSQITQKKKKQAEFICLGPNGMLDMDYQIGHKNLQDKL